VTEPGGGAARAGEDDGADLLVRHELRHGDGRRLWIYGELRGSLAGEQTPPSEPSALHQRYDALTDSWLAISPARNRRPFTGTGAPATTPSCPLCPGGPEVPFSYEAAVFENRFPSFVLNPPPVTEARYNSASRGLPCR
jgi:UDPglucose--hexose-1-phosphate uridylyltransferase